MHARITSRHLRRRPSVSVSSKGNLPLSSARLCPWTRTTLLTAHSFPPRTLPPLLHPPPLPPPPPPPVTPVATITCEPPPPPTRTTRPAEACCFPPAPQRNQGSAPTCAPPPRPLHSPRDTCSRRYDVEASPAASVLSSASTAFGGRGSSVPHAVGSRQVRTCHCLAPFRRFLAANSFCQSSSSVLGRDQKQRWTPEEAQRYASDRERESDRTWYASA